MLTLKLIVFTIVISCGVLGRDTRRGSARYRQGEYKYNHPPVTDKVKAIPVAVVYDNDSIREDKAIKSDITPVSNIDDISNEPTTSEPSIKKEPVKISSEVTNSDEITTKSAVKEETESKVTTYRPQREHQIPVAVVYEPEPTYYQKPRSNGDRLANKRIKSQQPASEEKHSGENEHLSLNAPVNGHTGIDFGSSTTKQEDLSTGKSNLLRLVPGKPITVEYNASTITPSEKKEEQSKTQTSSKPDTENIIVSVENTTPTTETRESPDKSQKAKAEQNKITQDNIKYTDTEKHTKRNNLTRVREVIPIVQSENVVFSHSGNFKYSYEGGDGTKAFEEGELKTFEDETAGEAVRGGFSFKAKDGNEYSLSYTADENGYRPVGAHLPTPPPIPPAIARALAYLATKATPEPVTESTAESDHIE